jgi:hypothetical protein
MNQTDEPKKTGSGRGGYRENAGRKPGSMSKLAHEAREKAQADGLLPHEILLDMARGEPQLQIEVDAEGNRTEKWVSLDIDARRDAAKAAAPYYAPKISTVEVIGGVADEQLDEFIARLAAEAGVSIGPTGEGETHEDGDADAPRTGSRRVRLDE